MLCSWLRLLVCEPAHVTRLPGSASGPGFAGPHSPLVPPLGSTCCSAARAASFWAGFTAYYGQSRDFSGPFIASASASGLPGAGSPLQNSAGTAQRYPGCPKQGRQRMPVRSTTTRSRPMSRDRDMGHHCLLQDGKHRHSEVGFRRSMAGLRYPLSTLRFAPHGSPRMTRGRCGSLRLHRRGLSPHTSCRSPGAPAHPIIPGGLGERVKSTPQCRSRSVPVRKECATSAPSGTAEASATEASR